MACLWDFILLLFHVVFFFTPSTTFFDITLKCDKEEKMEDVEFKVVDPPRYVSYSYDLLSSSPSPSPPSLAWTLLLMLPPQR